jgi:hypothetical protein
MLDRCAGADAGAGVKDASSSTVSLLNGVTSEIDEFNNMTMVDLDAEYFANSSSVVALFQELHSLLGAHFKAACCVSADPARERQLVPAYIICEYIFTIHDLKKIASGGEEWLCCVAGCFACSVRRVRVSCVAALLQ